MRVMKMRAVKKKPRAAQIKEHYGSVHIYSSQLAKGCKPFWGH